MQRTVVPSHVSPLRRDRATLIAAGVFFCAFPHMAHADVKVVTQVDVTGLPDTSSSSFPQTITTYYKDTLSRTDATNGVITLYDDANDKVTVMDPEKKTYYVTSLKKREEQQSSLSGRMADRLQLDTKLDLKPSDASSNETVTDLPAKKYDLTGSIALSHKEGGFGSGGMGGGGGMGSDGGMGGGGGFPGAGGGGGRHHGGGRSGGGGSMRIGSRMPKTEITGEVWLSDTIKLPTSKKFTVLPSAESMAFSGTPIIKSLAEKINKLDDLPVYSKITVTRFEPANETSQDGLYHAAQTVVTTVKVTSVSQEPIDASRFQVPNDYQKIDPPIEKASDFSNGKNDDSNPPINTP